VVFGLRKVHLDCFRVLWLQNDRDPYGNLRHLPGERDLTGGFYEDSERLKYGYVVHAYIWGSERLCCGG
jgi:hypothetical protein